MKKLCIILSLIAFRAVSYAQLPDFYFTYNYPGVRICGGIALETEDGNFLASAFEYGPEWFTYEDDNTSPAKILKLSATGELLGEMLFGEEGRRSTIVGLFPDPDQKDLYLAVGKIHDNELHCDHLLAYKFDNNLQPVWQKEIMAEEVANCFFFHGRSFMDAQGDIAYMTLPYEVLTQPLFHPQTYFKISSDDGTLLAVHEGEQPMSSYLVLGSFFEFQDGSGDYGHAGKFHSSNAIVRMNRDFEIIGEHPLPSKIPSPYGENGYELYFDFVSMDYPTVLSQPDSSLVIIWESHENFMLPKYRTDMSMLKTDYDGNVTASLLVGFVNDTTELDPDIRGVDRSGDMLYFCHGSYIVINDEYHLLEGTNLITVTKTDSDLNLIWQRYCRLDMNCQPHCITATKDGGCLITGSVFNEEISNMLAFKVLADGTVGCQETGIQIRPYLFYPNPAQNELHLQYSPDVTPKQIELYDLQGRLAQTQSKNLESLNMAGLPAGTYTMRVMLEGGKVFLDKVVKE